MKEDRGFPLSLQLLPGVIGLLLHLPVLVLHIDVSFHASSVHWRPHPQGACSNLACKFVVSCGFSTFVNKNLTEILNGPNQTEMIHMFLTCCDPPTISYIFYPPAVIPFPLLIYFPHLLLSQPDWPPSPCKLCQAPPSSPRRSRSPEETDCSATSHLDHPCSCW